MTYYLVQGMLSPCEDSAAFCWSGPARSAMEAIDFFHKAAAEACGLTEEDLEVACAEGEGSVVCRVFSSLSPILEE